MEKRKFNYKYSVKTENRFLISWEASVSPGIVLACFWLFLEKGQKEFLELEHFKESSRLNAEISFCLRRKHIFVTLFFIVDFINVMLLFPFSLTSFDFSLITIGIVVQISCFVVA